jgi:sugar lactone lactonase YvrE
MKHKWVFLLSAPMIAAASFVAACGDDDSAATPAPDGGPDTTTTPPTDGPVGGDSGNPDGGGQDAVADVADELTFTTLVAFKPPPSDFELPEGVVTVGGDPIVSLAPEGRLVKVGPDGGYATFAAFLPSQDALTTGLVADATNIYIAVGPNPFPVATPAPPPGVYKVAIASGGGVAPPNPTATPVNNATGTWGFPNGLVLENNTLWVSDSSGKIMRIADPAGVTPTATEWIASADLAGDDTKCNTGNFFDIGVNGLSADANYFYGVNYDKGIFFRIKREQDGGPGAIEKLYENCDFSGADGIAVDKDGSFLVANNLKHRIDRVTIAGTTATFKTIAAGPPLDSPATPFIDGTGATRRLLVTSSAFGKAFSGDAAVQATAKPALLSAPMP